MTREAGVVLGAMFAANAAKYVHRQSPSALLPVIQSDLGLSDLQAGLMASAFMASYMAAALPLGRLAASRPRQAWLAGTAAAWSAATAAMGLCRGLGGLLAARSAAGAAQAGWGCVGPSFVAEHHPAARRGFALAVFSAAVPVGSAAGYALAGRLASLWGWRWALSVLALPGLALAAALKLLPDAPAEAERTAAGNPDEPRPSWAAFPGLLASPSFLAGTLGMALATFCLGGLGVWMPAFLVRERGLGVAEAGGLFGAVTAGAGLAGILAGGWLSDRLSGRTGRANFLISGCGMLLGLPLAAGAVLAADQRLAAGLLFGAALLSFLYMGPLNAVIASATGPALRPLAFAANVFLVHLGDTLSPVAIGAASDAWGLKAALVLAVALMAPAAGLCFWGASLNDENAQA